MFHRQLVRGGFVTGTNAGGKVKLKRSRAFAGMNALWARNFGLA
jgi:hypothetical protein